MTAFPEGSAESRQAKAVITQINDIWKIKSSTAKLRYLLNSFLPGQSNAAYLADLMITFNETLKVPQKDATGNIISKETILQNFRTQLKKDYAIVSPEMEKAVLVNLLNRTYIELAQYTPNSVFKYGNAKGLDIKYLAKIQKSILFDTAAVMKMVNKNCEKFILSNDIITDIIREIKPTSTSILQTWSQADIQLKSLMPQYIGLREQYLKSRFIPDANSTLRLTYGHIRSFSPNDGETHTPYTTLDGVLAKANTNSDYRLPKVVQDNLTQTNVPEVFKDPKTGKIIVGILYNLDTTGGNSGSPVLNDKGELIGINFDRSFTATINDYAWNENYSRSIGCDIRYALYIIKYVGKADQILKELNLNL